MYGKSNARYHYHTYNIRALIAFERLERQFVNHDVGGVPKLR